MNESQIFGKLVYPCDKTLELSGTTVFWAVWGYSTFPLSETTKHDAFLKNVSKHVINIRHNSAHC
jgi:hypothetical protein